MIPRKSIIEWSETAPWKSNEHVEQDLLISRALVAIFSDDFLAENLAFRGGTALHKLYLSPQARYSEDIDLVQINPGPIKPIMYRLGEVLSFLPNRVTKQKRYNNTMLFRMESEMPPTIQMRLKIEINCFEHFNELGLVKLPFSVKSSWFSGDCEITTYHLEELLGTKMRALYQRKKGRDLFDLKHAMDCADIDVDRVIRSYRRYMSFAVEQPPSWKQFVNNMELKMQDADFTSDSEILLRPGIKFDPVEAYPLIKNTFIDRLKTSKDY